MTDYLIQLGLSNLLLSAALAMLALAVHRRGRYPALAHLLWVFVLLKAVTPPLLTLPVALGPGTDAGLGRAPSAMSAVAADATGPGVIGTRLVDFAAEGLVFVWLVGSVLVLTASLLRVRRFSRLLAQTSAEAPMAIQGVAETVARQLGLGSTPTIYLAAGRLSPMTWWTGGRVRVVIPRGLLEKAERAELQWVLAHELAHIKRRDHLVRWVEWLAVVAFWWNPIVWWARRNLRLAEEDACDAFVLDRIDGQPRTYARTLLSVAEYLAGRTTGTPSMATGIEAAESLERRLTRIVSPVRLRRASRRFVLGMMTVALTFTAFGFGAPADDGASLGQATRAVADDDLPSIEGRSAELITNRSDDVPATVPVAGTLTAGQIPSAHAIVGTAAADRVSGSARNETIIGRAGADELSGGAGRDVIRGGRGADTIRGGRGADTIRGGRGADTIRGGRGADTIAGDAGPDRLSGGAGDDVISGGSERDVIDGGAGKDTIDAGPGNDVVRSWRDGVADHVDCGSGNDDRAVVDSADSVVACEVVVIRDR